MSVVYSQNCLRKPVFLESLLNSSDLFLFDTSGFSGNERYYQSREEARECILKKVKNNSVLIKKIRESILKKGSNGRFYITPGVRHELIKSGFPYSKKIKRRTHQERIFLESWRAIREISKETRALAEEFYEQNKVIDITQTEQYQLAFEEHFLYMDSIGMSEVDKEFLITGIVLSKYRDICLVSNDFRHILFARDEICEIEKINNDQLKFYKNEETHFERLR